MKYRICTKCGKFVWGLRGLETMMGDGPWEHRKCHQLMFEKLLSSARELNRMEAALIQDMTPDEYIEMLEFRALYNAAYK